MKGSVTAIMSMVAATALVACASKGSTIRHAPAGASADDRLAAEYQSLIDNAMGQTVCRQEAVTGSRIFKKDVCTTRAERDAEYQRTLELLQEMDKRTMAMPQPMPSGSATAPSDP